MCVYVCVYLYTCSTKHRINQFILKYELNVVLLATYKLLLPLISLILRIKEERLFFAYFKLAMLILGLLVVSSHS